MKLPPLPDTFGNYALGDFVEIVPPEPISWLPQTAGWFWLGAGALVLVLRWLIKRARKWHDNRYRREARRRLEQLNHQGRPATFIAELNKLLKLTAIAGYSRKQVAPLSGPAWIAFLNAQCEQALFTTEVSNWLVQGPYASREPDPATRDVLYRAAVAWIETHRTPVKTPARVPNNA